MRRLFGAVYRFGLALLFLVLLAINGRLYYTPRSDAGALPSDVLPQLRFIRAALDRGSGAEMQAIFPEGYFFNYALYGLAWVETGLREPQASASRAEALREARWALAQVDGPAGRSQFSALLDPPYGVFYNGWSSWLRGGVLLLQEADARDATELARFNADCAALAAAFDRNASPFLQAYPGGSWPVDSVVAVAALRLHDNIVSPRFGNTIASWLQKARAHLDPATGLLPHVVDPASGAMYEGARGSSQSIIARFLLEIDADWGREQYALFRNQFVDTVFGVPGMHEYPRGAAGAGDVDSGPLFAGISLSASAVTAGAALAHGDLALAEPLLAAGESLGVPIDWGGSKSYAFGQLPVGDAFLVWAKTARPWLAPAGGAALPEVVAWWWRLPLHGVSLLIVLLVALPGIRRFRAQKS